MNGDNFEKERDLEIIQRYMKKFKEQKKLKKEFIINEKLKPGMIFILLFSAYIIVNTVNISIFRTDIYDVENNGNINIFIFFGSLAAVFAAVMIVYILLWKIKNLHKYILFFSSVVFAVGLVANNNLNIAYNITVLAILFYIINYCFQYEDEWGEWDDVEKNLKYGVSFYKPEILFSFKITMAVVSILALAFTVVISEACIVRYLAFRSSTYDFGIFAQMFENMAKTGLQITSVERNIQISHFAVHFSPIYYLILPFYMIFRSPESLFVIQAAAVGSGVFPLVLIAKKFTFSHLNILLIAAAYLFYPALSGGAFFDFHENKFLTVLILWLFYFIISVCPEKSSYFDNPDKYLKLKYICVYLFAVLTLTVKEDSFLYVFFIGLYMISLKKDDKFIKKNIIHGAIIAVLSLLYFLLSTFYLTRFGLGVMTYRFDLFLRINEDGFPAMVLNVLKNPALLFESVLSAPEKLEFIFYMFIPLCFLPFVSKRIHFIFLIIPMIIINLATDYIYQYDIHFQYTYGVIALLFFLTVKNLSKINIRHITKFCVAMACFSLVLFMSKNYNKIHSYNFIYFNFKEDFVEAEEIVRRIPMDASISASNFIVPHLIKRENVYNVEIGGEDYFDYDTDYLITDLREVDSEERYYYFLKEIKEQGYKKIDAGVFIEVFIKAEKYNNIIDN